MSNNNIIISASSTATPHYHHINIIPLYILYSSINTIFPGDLMHEHILIMHVEGGRPVIHGDQAGMHACMHPYQAKTKRGPTVHL